MFFHDLLICNIGIFSYSFHLINPPPSLPVCTPVGLAHLFTAMGRLVVKPGFLRDLAEEYQAAVLQEDALARQLDRPAHPHARAITRTIANMPTVEALLQQYHAVKRTRIKLGTSLVSALGVWCHLHPLLLASSSLSCVLISFFCIFTFIIVTFIIHLRLS